MLFSLISVLLYNIQYFVRGQHACESEIYCYGEILDTIQRAQLFLDPKRFVDMPTKLPKEKVLLLENIGSLIFEQVISNFKKLKAKPSAEDLHEFLEENFHKAGKELRIIMPKDFKANISLFNSLPNEKLRWFASEVHEKWKSLLRVVDKSHICQECESTMIDLPYPFLVPGGRFREYYYWDTYWILEGVYVSEMCETARMVVENTLWMAKQYGFVPNGSRTYYLNRSQPPMLPMIVERYYEECGRHLKNPQKFLERALDSLKVEHDFWTTKRSASIPDEDGIIHKLNFYSADMSDPRPESYLHDVKLAQNLNESEQASLYHNIAATTESGWDFSGRWLNWSTTKDRPEVPGLELSKTSDIIPVDLNSVLFRNELIISNLAAICGNYTIKEDFNALADKRIAAIYKILYSSELKMWKDYDLRTKKLMKDRPFYITDICPLWYGPYKTINASETESILAQQKSILYEYPAGIPVSESYTGQQWDFPNAWAPTQFLVIKLHLRLFEETNDPVHFKKAALIAQKWIDTTYCAYKHYGKTFEDINLLIRVYL